MSDKSSENGVGRLDAIFEASQLLRRVAEPVPAGDSVKAAILRAARRLRGWSHNRVREVWYCDRRVKLSADEMSELRAVARIKQQSADSAERDDLRARIERLEAILGMAGTAIHPSGDCVR